MSTQTMSASLQIPQLDNLDFYIEGCYNNQNLKTQRECISNIRRLVSLEHDPPIDDILNASHNGISFINRLMEMVDYKNNGLIDSSHDHKKVPTIFDRIKFEASWILVNLSSGTHEQVRLLIEYGLLPKIIDLMSSKTEQTQINAVWACGNCAGDSPEFRDLVLNEVKLFDKFTKLCNLNLSLCLERNVAWTLSNLARGKPAPKLAFIHKIIECLCIMVESKDKQILRDIMWGFCYISSGDNVTLSVLNINHDEQQNNLLLVAGYIRVCCDDILIPIDIIGVCCEYFIIIENGIQKLIELLNFNDAHIVHPALRSVGNFLLLIEDDRILLDVLKTYKVYQTMNYLLVKTKRSKIRKECVNILGKLIKKSNTVAEGVLFVIIQIIRFDKIDIACESLITLSNIIKLKQKNTVNYFISLGGIQLLLFLLNTYSKSQDIMFKTQEILETLFKIGTSNQFIEYYGYNQICHYFQYSIGYKQLIKQNNHELETGLTALPPFEDEIINSVIKMYKKYSDKTNKVINHEQNNQNNQNSDGYYIPRLDETNLFDLPSKKYNI